jgi:phosphatidate cytidylyltransferase
MSNQLAKRIYTSIILLIFLILMYFYSYILIISLIIISLIAWVEFNSLIYKIFSKKNFKNISFRFISRAFSLSYLFYFSFLISKEMLKYEGNEIFVIYSLLVCINSDIGGLIFGKIFKGKKLTKISPNKTISGTVGSFFFSFILIPIFSGGIIIMSFDKLFITTFLISLISQIGDLFISFLKRKAKVKDTGDILPGHGGILDRIDGIIFGIPFGILLFNLL